jgi:hypothetical protein
MANKIPKNLAGPERWALVDKITNEPKQNARPKPGKFKQKNFKDWSSKQLDAYATVITGIKPNSGTNKDRKAGRNKGRYIKGLV